MSKILFSIAFVLFSFIVDAQDSVFLSKDYVLSNYNIKKLYYNLIHIHVEKIDSNQIIKIKQIDKGFFFYKSSFIEKYNNREKLISYKINSYSLFFSGHSFFFGLYSYNIPLKSQCDV